MESVRWLRALFGLSVVMRGLSRHQTRRDDNLKCQKPAAVHSLIDHEAAASGETPKSFAWLASGK
jgi:hypothetical protein